MAARAPISADNTGPSLAHRATGGVCAFRPCISTSWREGVRTTTAWCARPRRRRRTPSSRE
eukprot:455608-Alexandrium_andersonii.AAC.1